MKASDVIVKLTCIYWASCVYEQSNGQIATRGPQQVQKQQLLRYYETSAGRIWYGDLE